MKLEPNMYVRTKDGIIAKCTEIRVNRYMFDRIILENGYYNDWEFIDIPEEKSLIKKSSHNIMDLIEIGDYVNGIRVGYINKGENYFYALADENTIEIICGYDSDGFTKPLNSIVTKEQFESMAYKVDSK